MSAHTLTPRQMTRWHRAILAQFFASGLLTSSLLARIPDFSASLGITAGPLGILLFMMMLGSFLTVSCSGMMVTRFGSRPYLLVAYAVGCAGIVLVGLGAHLGSIPLATVGLVLQGAGTAGSNVGSNIQSVSVERALGRFVTPYMHGCFAVGSVVGAFLATADTHAGIPLLWHMVYFALIIMSIVLFTYSWLHSENMQAPDEAEQQSPTFRVRDAWRDKHTILLGLFCLGMALAEGSANDWIALGLTQDYGMSHTGGSLGYATFVVAMTISRFAGSFFLNRYGRTRVLRVSCCVAIFGVLLFIFAPVTELGLVGAFLWGIGVSLGFPTGISAASDDPLKSSVRVSVVFTFGYIAFLGGPPMVGWLAELLNVRHALLVILPFMLMSLALTRYLGTWRSSTQTSAQ